MKFPLGPITAVPDRSTSNIQMAMFGLNDAGGTCRVPLPLSAPTWSSAGKQAKGARWRPESQICTDIHPSCPVPASPVSTGPRQLTRQVQHGGVEAGSVMLFSTPTWAHAHHPWLPRGRCWPKRVQSRPVTSHVHSHRLVWRSSQSGPARGLALNSPRAPSPSHPSAPSTRARAGIGPRQPHVHGRDRETPSQKRETRQLRSAP